MAQKPAKPPAAPAARKPQKAIAITPANPRPQADSRWQRTVRFAWDKGGAKGGRR